MQCKSRREDPVTLSPLSPSPWSPMRPRFHRKETVCGAPSVNPPTLSEADQLRTEMVRVSMARARALRVAGLRISANVVGAADAGGRELMVSELGRYGDEGD